MKNWIKKLFCTHEYIKMVAKFDGLEHKGHNIQCRNCGKILK